ncbi:MAG: hypothetical protein ABJL55_02630 [Roseibium sp.]|uniref:hypothetical protein n=1 Tax=Sulfitobacter sp. TaxID=1903071 RepID=UPI00329805AA
MNLMLPHTKALATLLTLIISFSGAIADPIAGVRAGLGVSIFDEMCVDSLPDFMDAKRKLKDKHLEKRGDKWIFESEPFVTSVSYSSKECVAIVGDGEKKLVDDEMSKLLKKRYSGFLQNEVNGKTEMHFTSRAGPAIVFIESVSSGVALMVQIQPN